MSKGIKPVFVFDGKPPELKINELRKRKNLKENAEQKVKEAEATLEKLKEEGNQDNEAAQQAIAELDKQAKRSTRITQKHNEDVQKLLRLMGLPIILAPSEAEAQCAELVKSGKVFGAATEDMDALTFGAPVMLRRMSLAESAAQTQPPLEIHLEKVLSLLELTMDQFIDMCILLGCDYAPTIKGVGPKKGFQLIKEHKTLEKAVASLDPAKYQIPDELLESVDAIREIFKRPEVLSGKDVEFTWGKVDEEGVTKYLVEENGFDPERVKNALKRLNEAKKATSQKRMDSFFKVKASVAGTSSGSASKGGFKRPADSKKKPKGVKRRR